MGLDGTVGGLFAVALVAEEVVTSVVDAADGVEAATIEAAADDDAADDDVDSVLMLLTDDDDNPLMVPCN